MTTDNVINTVTQTGIIDKAQKTTLQSTKLAEDFSNFLRLLTTQLQNQDPLNPMDSNEFTNQIVQFSQVEQQINTNQKLDNLLSIQLTSSTGMALGYVGLDINYTSSEMNYDGENPVTISYLLAKKASISTVSIYDEAGQLVFNGNVPGESGKNQYLWNGMDTNGNPVGPGTYSLRVSALDSDQKPIEASSTAVSGRVRGIENQNGIINLLVGDRAVPLDAVINAITPPKPVLPEGGA